MADGSKVQQDLGEFIKGFSKSEWKNEHGERFVIHTNGISVMMSGDEVTAMVDSKHLIDGKYLPLFNPAFSIWQEDELYSLGEALIKSVKELKKRRVE